MTKVNCSVENCSYNENHICYAKRVAVGGQQATEEEVTCCGTFLNKQVYSNLAEYTAYKPPCENVSCTVNTCQYMEDGCCTLKEIEVRGKQETTVYMETDCSSFELK